MARLLTSPSPSFNFPLVTTSKGRAHGLLGRKSMALAMLDDGESSNTKFGSKNSNKIV